MTRHSHRGQLGFSLIAISVILTVGMVILASLLPGQDAGDYNQKVINNVQKLDAVEEAMAAFMTANGRLPCPADGQYGIDDVNFGVEAASPNGTCANGTPAAPLGPSGNVVGGNIPTKTLGIASGYALDDFGRRFTYVVDARATTTATCYTLQTAIANSRATPGIQINDGTGTAMDHVLHAYISHGPDGDGAWPAQGSTVAGRINTHSADADTLTNASVNSDFSVNFTNVRVKKDRTATFDDLVYYWDHATYPKYTGGQTDAKTTCCLGVSCTALSPPGFRIDGAAVNDMSGYSVAVGDINGDGIPDLIIGVPGDNSNNGAVYVVFGTRNGFPNPLPLSSLDGTNGFKITGANGKDAGESVTVGDINGDGVADIIFSAIGSTNSVDHVYVVFGHTGTWSTPLNISSLNGSNGFVINMDNNPVPFIRPVTSGDINGDGIADIIIGEPANPEVDSSNGRVAVVFGHTGAWPASMYASESTNGGGVLNGVNGFMIYIPTDITGLGIAVATGDVNGDGVSDLIVGADNASYVVFGQTEAWPSLVNLSNLNGSNGFAINGSAGQVASGDINGDGIQDIIVGGVNLVDVIFGHTGTWSTSFNLSSLNGTIGFELDGPYGCCSVAVGDINGDGNADLIIGAPFANYGDAGAAYVVFGHTGAWTTPSNVSSLNGTNGFELDGPTSSLSYAGWAVAAGDINGDGISDVIISAPYASPGENAQAGSTYVFFGAKQSSWTTPYNLSNLCTGGGC